MLETHLGGHFNVTHLDNGVLEWSKENLSVKSMLDIGCGPGGMVELALSKNIDAIGIDGDHTVNRFDKDRFIIQDFTKGPAIINRIFDLAWSVEFVEHVEEKYVPNYMKAFSQCKYVIMSFAPKGAPGYHHVNCRDNQYWIDVFTENEFRFDHNLTLIMKSKSSMKRNFLRNNGLVFVNKKEYS